MVAQPPKTRIRADAYYQLPEYEANDLIQLIDGEVVVSMAPTPNHQIISGEISYLLKTVERQKGGYSFYSPIEVFLDEYNIFEPDLLYLVPNSGCIVTDKRLEGPPNLVVEILSPSTATYDKREKYEAYEKHGVGEYWIVDPVHQIIEVWVLSNSQFIRLGVFGQTDTFKSKVLQETIDLNLIFKQ